MKSKSNVTKIIILILSVFILSISPNVYSSNITNDYKDIINQSAEESELHLIRVEHYLVCRGKEDVGIFNVTYAFPPDYAHQTPVLLEVHNDSTEDIIKYRILNDELEPNKLVKFTIDSINKDEEKLIHFSVWVLVEEKDFSDFPSSVVFPSKSDLPNETHKWLSATEVSQKDNFLIKTRSKIMSIFNDDVISYANKVTSFIINHRYGLFLLQLNIGMFFSQDAVTTYLINGENVGRSHLACSLFRNQNIPARVILVNNDQGFWTQMHYMVEYYVPDYGWVSLCTTRGKTPFDTSRQVINRICHPEDENDTKTDYIFKKMKGEERWIWFDNENVTPLYINCREGSKSQMFSENEIVTCKSLVDECFNWSRQTQELYQLHVGTNLSTENLEYFEAGYALQKDAVFSLKNNDIYDFYYQIRLAFEKYDKIVWSN